MGKKHKTHMGNGGSPIDQYTYPPNGTDHSLQQVITNLLHNIVLENGDFTLAELGYMNINTLMYNREHGQINLKVYFDARLAARIIDNPVNRRSAISPVKELEVFQNYLYVGSVFDVITYETITAPKGKIAKDELGRMSLSFKDEGKMVDTKALVLNCSLPLTIAAAHDINLTDPQFKVECSTVGKGGKDVMRSIISTASVAEVPVSLTITATHGDEYVGYEPKYAYTYLTSLASRLSQAARNQEKLSDKVRSDAKKAKKKDAGKPKTNKHFDKYS